MAQQYVKINKVRDLVERVGCTFVQAYIGLGALDWLSNGVNADFLNQLYVSAGAAAAATIKVLIAQRFGKTPTGDAIPGGGVIETNVPVTEA
jgi:hypothetical protein